MKKANALFLLLTLFLAPLSYSTTLELNKPSLNSRGYLFEIHGSNTIGAHLAPTLVEQWLRHHQFETIERRKTTLTNEVEIWARTPASGMTIKVKIAAHGSSTGFLKLQSNTADIAAASRPVKHSENALFPSINLAQYENETVLAIDGLAIIAHPALNISHLTITQLGQIFSGEITNWADLGGPNLDVTVHSRDGNSGTFDTFKALVLSRGYSLTEEALRYESNEALSRQVAMSPGAIGFTAFASIGQAKVIAIVDGESLPMPPVATSIATEDYPLSRRLYLYQANTENNYALDFLSFVKSQAGQRSVEQAGFVSQNLSEVQITPNEHMPQGYRFLVSQAHRLTTNFRFVPGTKQLDNKALDDLERLSNYMNRPENQTREVFLVGFVNKQSNEFRAQILSEARVQSVKNKLRLTGVETNAMTGYGELNPVSDNSDERYALRNQRVEVWIK